MTEMDWKELTKAREERAKIIAGSRGLPEAAAQGKLEQFQDVTLNEAVVLGLLNQGVRKFFAVFGHGSTDLGEVLRVYQAAGAVQVYNLRSEIEASHAASLLRWRFNEYSAVVTSIGPGALHAFSASLVGQSNGLGIYYLFGDETTHNEGPNMQQIPKREQNLYAKLTDVMGKGYTLTEKQSVFTALKWAWTITHDPAGERPFYLLLPMNVQSSLLKACNLLELPSPSHIPKQSCGDELQLKEAAEQLSGYRKVTVKLGGGAAGVSQEQLRKFLRAAGAVCVHSPHLSGCLPYEDPLQMTVGGSKGSLSGNYAMEHCELAVTIGARGVCQWDSSGTAWKKAEKVISINTRAEDALQYNRTIPLIGSAELILAQLTELLDEPQEEYTQWQLDCMVRKEEWNRHKQQIYGVEKLFDEKWGREVLTQPAAIKAAIDFADSVDAVKLFDAGDVQANGFQAVEDRHLGMTITDTGASYMGFGVSALLACAAADAPKYGIAFSGDGSFLMNPQVLLDGAYVSLHGMILIFDNRRMSAISNLQIAQYGTDFATDDTVAVDYASLAESFSGVKGIFAGYAKKDLEDALREAYDFPGLSVVHIPVYFGAGEGSDLGVFGSWNVGNWCEGVQAEKHKIGL